MAGDGLDSWLETAGEAELGFCPRRPPKVEPSLFMAANAFSGHEFSVFRSGPVSDPMTEQSEDLVSQPNAG